MRAASYYALIVAYKWRRVWGRSIQKMTLNQYEARFCLMEEIKAAHWAICAVLDVFANMFVRGRIVFIRYLSCLVRIFLFYFIGQCNFLHLTDLKIPCAHTINRSKRFLLVAYTCNGSDYARRLKLVSEYKARVIQDVFEVLGINFSIITRDSFPPSGRKLKCIEHTFASMTAQCYSTMPVEEFR